MNVFRFSGSPSWATRSAEMIVPWMTSRSSPALASAGVNARAFCGLTRTAVVIPASRMRATAAPSSSGSKGAECNCCNSRIETAGSGSFSAASTTSAMRASTSACRPISPSPLSTPSPPRRPSSIANSTLTSASVGCATTGMSNRYASSCHAVDTSFDDRVRRDGTMLMSWSS